MAQRSRTTIERRKTMKEKKSAYVKKMTKHTLLVETMLFMHSKQFDMLDTHYKYLIIELVEIAGKEKE